MNKVDCTSHIKFHSDVNTFCLYAANSLYTFCIGPDLTLEHIYWGVKVDDSYDMRYICQSVRNNQYNRHNSTTESEHVQDQIHPQHSVSTETDSSVINNQLSGRKGESSRDSRNSFAPCDWPPQLTTRCLGKLGKSALSREYSDHGTGDYRSPSFMVVDNSNGSSISPLRYKRHAIYRGKLPMPDSMPAIRCLHEDEASTLVVTMADSITGLEVDLVYGKLTYLHYLSDVHDAELVSIICLSQLRCTTTTSSHGAQCFAT